MIRRRPTPDPDIQLVAVFRTSDPAMVAMVKSLLADADIDYCLRGEAIRSPFSNVLGTTEFQVRDADALEATRLIARLVS